LENGDEVPTYPGTAASLGRVGSTELIKTKCVFRLIASVNAYTAFNHGKCPFLSK
jgi:hypothetical protein